MDVSIIIPTRNRSEELDKVLSCILSQTRTPREIIVVDDSDDSKTAILINKITNKFSNKGILLNYIRNTTEKGLTNARNLGTKIAECDVVLFLDDDVILDDKYVEEILNVYRRHPNAIGIQGHISMNHFSVLTNAINKVFYLSHVAKNKWMILPSGEETFPYPLTKVINCPRLSGANQSYKRTIFQSFNFDEALEGYAFAEDKEFSYAIYKKYPDTLYVTPYARLVHKESKKSRLPEKCRIYMNTVYGMYFFYKHIHQTFLNKITFIWSKIGQLITTLGDLILNKKAKSEWLTIVLLVESYFYALRHKEEIKRGNLAFLNEKLKTLAWI